MNRDDQAPVADQQRAARRLFHQPDAPRHWLVTQPHLATHATHGDALPLSAQDELLKRFDIHIKTNCQSLERLRMKPELAPELVEYKAVDYTLIKNFFARNHRLVCKSWQELLQGRAAWHLVALKERYCFHRKEDDGSFTIDWQREDDQPRLLRALRDEYAVICHFRACDLYNAWDYVCPSGQRYPVHMPCQHCGYLFPGSNVVLQPGSSLSAGRSFVWTCEDCEADGGLCAEACMVSYRTKWRKS